MESKSLSFFIKRRLFISLCLFAASFSFSLFAWAESSKTYKLGYGKIEGYIESATEGVGTELLNEVLRRVKSKGYEIEARYQPSLRAISNFIKGEADICFPIINGGDYHRSGYKEWNVSQMPAHSAPLYTAGGFVIYSRSDKQVYDSLDALNGKKVGVIRGAYIPAALKRSKTILVEEVNSGEQNFEKLLRGRIDAFLVQKQWAMGILKQTELKGFHRGKEFDKIIGSFIFQQTQEGMNLLAEFNYAIGSMILDGTYAAILDRYPESKMVIKYP